jgi:hypothetical protein
MVDGDDASSLTRSRSYLDVVGQCNQFGRPDEREATSTANHLEEKAGQDETGSNFKTVVFEATGMQAADPLINSLCNPWRLLQYVYFSYVYKIVRAG